MSLYDLPTYTQDELSTMSMTKLFRHAQEYGLGLTLPRPQLTLFILSVQDVLAGKSTIKVDNMQQAEEDVEYFDQLYGSDDSETTAHVMPTQLIEPVIAVSETPSEAPQAEPITPVAEPITPVAVKKTMKQQKAEYEQNLGFKITYKQFSYIKKQIKIEARALKLNAKPLSKPLQTLRAKMAETLNTPVESIANVQVHDERLRLNKEARETLKKSFEEELGFSISTKIFNHMKKQINNRVKTLKSTKQTAEPITPTVEPVKQSCTDLIPYFNIIASVPTIIALPYIPLTSAPRRVFTDDAPTEPMDSANRNITNDICQFVQTSNQHLCINALAGCGKTYTLKKICSMECMQDKSILYLVFNKKNQLEAEETFKELPNVTALTTHKFLGDIVRKELKTSYMPMGGPKKMTVIINHLIEKYTNPSQAKVFCSLVKTGKSKEYTFNYVLSSIVEQCQCFAVDPKAAEAKTLISEQLQQYMMNKGYGSITYQSGEPAHIQLVDIAVEALSLALICNKSTGIYEKNYDVGYKMEDSLYLFAVLGLKPTKYDIVCCDEAQDFNICQIKMVERFAQQGSRVIFVGDPNQSIYAFRGSCTSAFAQIKEVLPNCHEMNLKVNYRCDPRIIQFTNENSCVTSMIAGNSIHEDRQVIPECDKLYFLDNVKAGDAVLSRNNEPLAEYACYIYTRGLCPSFIKDTYKGSVFIQYLRDAMTTFYRKMCETSGRKFYCRNLNKDIMNLFSMQDDNALALTVKKVLRQDGDCIDNMADFQQCLRETLSKIPEQNSVWFMTVHASKGLEYDNVWFIRYNEFAEKIEDQNTDDQQTQEKNAEYIAFTRARLQLKLVHGN